MKWLSFDVTYKIISFLLAALYFGLGVYFSYAEGCNTFFSPVCFICYLYGQGATIISVTLSLVGFGAVWFMVNHVLSELGRTAQKH